MNYQEWEKTVPIEITNDSLWKMEAYRLGLFLSDICWYDVTKLLKDRRTIRLSDQLLTDTGQSYEKLPVCASTSASVLCVSPISESTGEKQVS